MKNYSITSGKFTGKGNFTGYTAKGERLFVHNAQMKAIGAEKDADLTGKFPLFAIGATKTINPYDENGEAKKNADGSLATSERLQALSIFLTKADLIAAHVDDSTLDIEIAQQVKATATAAGLTEQQLSVLMAASV